MPVKNFTLFVFLLLSLQLPAQKAHTEQRKYTSRIHPQSSKEHFIQMWYTADGKMKNAVTVTTSVEMLPLNNKPAWAFIQHYHTEKNIDSDTTFFDEKSLQPLAYFTNLPSEGYREIVSFEKEAILVQVLYKDSVAVKKYHQAGNYIQATLLSYFIAKLPLKKGYSTSLRHINAGLHYTDLVSDITVLGKENIAVTEKLQIPCWKIEVTTGGAKTIQWLTVQDQSLLKLEFGNPQKMLFKKMRILW